MDLWFESERKSACVYNWQDRLTQAEPDQALKEQGQPNEAYSWGAAGNRLSSAHQAGVGLQPSQPAAAMPPGARRKRPRAAKPNRASQRQLQRTRPPHQGSWITRAYGFNPHPQQARINEEDEDAEEGL